jgi:hypothetical protein
VDKMLKYVTGRRCLRHHHGKIAAGRGCGAGLSPDHQTRYE